ncbi:maleylpyruvate isomerase N-terminal domain-containing protein [Streptomyces sp. NPDC048720]|uniref:maleylpyruvate isomerase N-terminal domain-containing protein n=1 Tax=Streptomyces sp. NPDC048720 TaxID=3365588 RepID=UPI0037193EE6
MTGDRTADPDTAYGLRGRLGGGGGTRRRGVPAPHRLHRLGRLYTETVAATGRAAACVDPAARVATQGHVLTAGDLMTTLAVEATVHHLDMVVRLPHAPGPSRAVPAAVRSTLDGPSRPAHPGGVERPALRTRGHRAGRARRRVPPYGRNGPWRGGAPARASVG